jgi:hypothetical protein
MRGIRARSLGYSAGVLTLVVLAWILAGQAALPVKRRVSLPTDWSHRHVVFSNPTNAAEYERVIDEPRFLQQLYRREFPAAPVRVSAETVSTLAKKVSPKAVTTMHRDWSVSLGSGASMGQGNYPAKFGFDVTKASCSDYVVYSTGLLGSGTQASIVGFTNIYSGGGCGTSPTINWAYNTLGQILTSPITSLDGTQVAFAETNGGLGLLVLLKWAASGTETVGAPMTLANQTSGTNYRSCTAPCMFSIRLRDNLGTDTNDTTSSVFYDYKNDIIWVGGERGWVHKIKGAFLGTPAEVTTGGFPVHVPAGSATSSAVYDRVSNKVFVADESGFVNAINATTGVVTRSGQLNFGALLVDAPIIDQAAGSLYMFASADSGGGSCVTGTCAAVYQLTTTFASGDTGTEVSVGDSTGATPMFIGGFDSTYFSSTNRTGNLYVCGNDGSPATLYQIPLTAGVLGPETTLAQLATNAATVGCSPVTDVPNPNTVIGPAERIFVSVQDNGRYAACGGGGCLFNFVVAQWKPSTGYVVGQQILSSRQHVETVVSASGNSGASVPVWTTTAGSTKTDGGVVWIDQGNLTAMNTVVGWQASFQYVLRARIIDSNGNVELATTPGTSGPGPGAPAWNPAIGQTTPDGAVTWTNVGFSGTVALPSAGGTSGIIEDNVVSPLVTSGASQVYFGTLSDQGCTSGGTGGCAVQASQPALQ